MAETYLCQEKCYFRETLYHKGQTLVPGPQSGEELPPYFVKRSQADAETLEYAKLYPVDTDEAYEGEEVQSMSQLQKSRSKRAAVGMLAGLPKDEDKGGILTEEASASEEKASKKKSHKA